MSQLLGRLFKCLMNWFSLAPSWLWKFRVWIQKMRKENVCKFCKTSSFSVSKWSVQHGQSRVAFETFLSKALNYAHGEFDSRDKTESKLNQNWIVLSHFRVRRIFKAEKFDCPQLLKSLSSSFEDFPPRNLIRAIWIRSWSLRFFKTWTFRFYDCPLERFEFEFSFLNRFFCDRTTALECQICIILEKFEFNSKNRLESIKWNQNCK